MVERDILMLINDELGITLALLKTVNMAIGNTEYFGDDGQNVAITLDVAVTKLEECRDLLSSPIKNTENER